MANSPSTQPRSRWINVILPDDAFLPVRYRITDMQGHTHESVDKNQRDIKLMPGFLPSEISRCNHGQERQEMDRQMGRINQK
ncbi:MAG: hypothetical protein IPP49_18940 [Saprospiraceae bacterium]|nr:hypothetical protein [Saprospiraceae bacterium]